jgi:hypothetical protein
MTSTTLLPFQPDAMAPARLAAVSYLARYTGQTHSLYTYQLRRWFTWCETNTLEPLVGIHGRTSSCTSVVLTEALERLFYDDLDASCHARHVDWAATSNLVRDRLWCVVVVVE